jgi:PKHD-type hydroxylase
MFIEIDGVLTAEEIGKVKSIAATTPFVDGKISNPHNQAKNNLQADPNHAGYRDSSQIFAQALWRSEEFRNYAFPKRFAAPMLCRYQPGMNYGPHADSAYIPLRPEPLRSDVSVTIFLNDPSTYDGGELVIHLGSKPIPIKGKPGSAIVYPSTTIHEVAPVTRGERLVAITFVESQICDERYRDLLYTLNEVAALEGLKMDWQNRTRLEHVRHSLHRIWST